MPTAIDLFKDIESERAILQSFLLDPELLYQVHLKTTDFTSIEYRAIYESMLKVYSEGIVLELKPLMDMNTKDITASTLFNLADTAVTAANINYHVRCVKKASFNRKCREELSKLQPQIGNKDFLAEIEKSVMQLHNFNSDSKFHSVPEIINRIRINIEEAKKTRNYGVQTGFEKLNEACVGLCPRHLWLLGGYTSYGKSTWLSQMIDDVCTAGNSVLLFSVEDSKEDKLTRLIATKSGIPIRSIVKSQCDPVKLAWAEKEIETYDLNVYDDVYTIEEMDLKVRKHKMLSSVDIVAVDFVQNIIAKGEGIYDRMSQVAIGLQQMAKRHNVCVFALSQVSAEEKGAIKLRGAQELASAADIVLWIDRDATNEKRDFSLIVRKNRPFGKTGKMFMSFNETWTNVMEI